MLSRLSRLARPRLSRLARQFSAGWYRVSYFGRRIGDKRIVAGLATMPSRASTFPVAFRSIVHQVDRLYLYLDGHQEVPEVARSDSRVIPIFRFPPVTMTGTIFG